MANFAFQFFNAGAERGALTARTAAFRIFPKHAAQKPNCGHQHDEKREECLEFSEHGAGEANGAKAMVKMSRATSEPECSAHLVNDETGKPSCPRHVADLKERPPPRIRFAAHDRNRRYTLHRKDIENHEV